MSKITNNTKVLVTGGTGFLGSHLVDKLYEIGCSVDIWNSKNVNMLNRSSVGFELSMKEYDIIFHLAAKVGGIGANKKSPGDFFFANMQMGMNLLDEVCTLNQLKQTKVVIAGSCCSYPLITPIPFKETDLWKGLPEPTNMPYGIAKKALLVMAQSYRLQYNCNFVMPILANLYGPRDNFDLENSHVIPAMIKKFVDAKEMNSSEVILWGDGSVSREFLYVDDAVEGLIAVAENYDESDPINLGTGEEIKIKELATKISRLVGFNGKIKWDVNYPNGQPRRALDTSKAKKKLNFKAKTPLMVGLSNTVNYYESFAK